MSLWVLILTKDNANSQRKTAAQSAIGAWYNDLGESPIQFLFWLNDEREWIHKSLAFKIKLIFLFGN